MQASYRLPTSQRGLFAVGPMEFRCTDPFGLSALTRVAAGSSTLCVHPAFDMLAPLDLDWSGSDHTELGETRPATHGDEFYALREYQLGDDLRRVHWASSARTDRLMIRQDQEQTSNRLLVIGDLRHSQHTSASFERTLSAMASLADAGLRGGHSVRVACAGGADSGWGHGAAHALSILDLLAAAEMDGATTAISLRRCLWERSAAASAVIVVATDGVSALDLPSGAPAQGGAVVVIERTQAATDPGPTLPWPVVSVPVSLPFAAAWAARPAALR